MIFRVHKQKGMRQSWHPLLWSLINSFWILQLSKRTYCLAFSPFSIDTEDAPYQLQLELNELQCDDECHSRHQQLSVVNFYRQVDKGDFKEIANLVQLYLSVWAYILFYELEQKQLEVKTKWLSPISTTALKSALQCAVKSRSLFSSVSVNYLLLGLLKFIHSGFWVF